MGAFSLQIEDEVEIVGLVRKTEEVSCACVCVCVRCACTLALFQRSIYIKGWNKLEERMRQFDVNNSDTVTVASLCSRSFTYLR